MDKNLCQDSQILGDLGAVTCRKTTNATMALGQLLYDPLVLRTRGGQPQLPKLPNLRYFTITSRSIHIVHNPLLLLV